MEGKKSQVRSGIGQEILNLNPFVKSLGENEYSEKGAPNSTEEIAMPSTVGEISELAMRVPSFIVQRIEILARGWRARIRR